MNNKIYEEMTREERRERALYNYDVWLKTMQTLLDVKNGKIKKKDAKI